MILLVLGASGRTGSFVAAHMFAAGETVFALVRDVDDHDETRRLGRVSSARARPGVVPVAGDLLGDQDHLVELMRGCDAVVDATGCNSLTVDSPGVDREGKIAAIEAAGKAGVRRYVQVSAMYADRPEEGPEPMRAVLAAKRDSDTALMRSGLDWTIVRPGGLADSVLTGQVEIARRLDHSGSIAREDVAAVVGGCLSMSSTVGLAFDVIGGGLPILPALARIAPVD